MDNKKISGSFKEKSLSGFITEKDRKKIKDNLKILLSEFTNNTKIECKETDEGFELTVPQPGDRKQKVYITTDRRDSDGEDIYQIFTICTESDARLFEFALRANLEIDYGALAIKEIFGTDYLVLVNTQLVKSAQAVELEKSVLTLAEIGDDIEQIVTGKDIH